MNIPAKKLKSILNNTARFKKISYKNYCATFDANFCSGKEIEFIDSLESLISTGLLMKDDKKARLIKNNYDSQTIVIKHCKYINWGHSIAHTITPSRARNCWNNSIHMQCLEIPTPKPLACIELFKMGIMIESYFIYSFADGFRLRDYLWNNQSINFLKEKHLHDVYSIIKKIKQHRITHGDLKLLNIIITDNGPVFIDIDQAKFHKCNSNFRRKRLKDLRRLRKELPWNFSKKT